MLYRKVMMFVVIGIFAGISVFGQDVAKVKEFERARRVIPLNITLNLFGFGIGSFLQGDTTAAWVQVGLSTAGYAFLLSGMFGKFYTNSVGRRGTNYIFEKDVVPEVNYAAKYTLIGIGSAFMAANALVGAIRPALYQFDKKFDTFYDINNAAKWPGGGD
jgi:hypothetical protein